MNDTVHTASGDIELNHELLRAVIKVNTWLLALVFACVGGLSLFLMTYISLYRGLPDPGQFLELLGVFLPGYSVTHTGAWIGLCWGALIGALIAVIFYRIYARGIAHQVTEFIAHDRPGRDLLGITLRMDGNYLGLALGAIFALGLLATTNWLVLRGTAGQSEHAQLLAQYLPGYTVSTGGSLVGAFEVFACIYLLCRLFSFIYNRVVAARGR